MNARRVRLVAMLSAVLTIVAALVLPASRALAKGSLTIEPVDGVRRDYQAWRVLAGCVTEDGRSIYDAAYTSAMPAESWQALGAPDGGAQAVADWLDTNTSVVLANEVNWAVEDSGVAADAEGTYPPKGNGVVAFDNLDDGLWLVSSDKSSPVLVLVGGGSTRTVTEKAEAPSLQKQVRVNDGAWASDAVAPVGSSLEYRLVGTLPRNYDSFSLYPYRFDDSWDDSIEVDQTSVRVELGGEDVTSKAQITFDNNSLSVAFDNLKDELSELGTTRMVTVTYAAKLGTNATAGLMDTNKNTATLAYPERPTRGTALCTVSSNHTLRVATASTKIAATSNESSAGVTEPTESSVITWKLKVTKVGGAKGEALARAGFTIQRTDGTYLAQDGTTVGDASQAYVWHTGDDGMFEVAGLGNGTLTITEVEAPNGYNVAAPFSVTFDGDSSDLTAAADGCTLDSVDPASGTVAVTVSDKAKDNGGSTNNGGSANNGSSDNGGATTNGSGNGRSLEMPSWLPITGDTAVTLGVALLVAGAGMAAMLIARRFRRSDKE